MEKFPGSDEEGEGKVLYQSLPLSQNPARGITATTCFQAGVVLGVSEFVCESATNHIIRDMVMHNAIMLKRICFQTPHLCA